MDREALRALPAVQGKQREAEVDLARYREKPEQQIQRSATPSQLQCGGSGIQWDSSARYFRRRNSFG